MLSVCPGGSFLRLAEDRARLGDVAEREVLLDRERIDVAPQSAMREASSDFSSEPKSSVPSASSA